MYDSDGSLKLWNNEDLSLDSNHSHYKNFGLKKQPLPCGGPIRFLIHHVKSKVTTRSHHPNSLRNRNREYLTTSSSTVSRRRESRRDAKHCPRARHHPWRPGPRHRAPLQVRSALMYIYFSYLYYHQVPMEQEHPTASATATSTVPPNTKLLRKLSRHLWLGQQTDQVWDA